MVYYNFYHNMNYHTVLGSFYIQNHFVNLMILKRFQRLAPLIKERSQTVDKYLRSTLDISFCDDVLLRRSKGRKH